MNNYSHGKHSFVLDYDTFDGSKASHEVVIEVGRSRDYDAEDVHTWIGIFHDEKFTGASVTGWGSEEHQSEWAFTVQGVICTGFADFIMKLVKWLPEEDFNNFIEDLKENKRWEGQFTHRWQRGCSF